MAHKIVTYSMDPTTLDRMDKLMGWMGINNKSKLLASLVEREYFVHKRRREEGDDSQE